LGLQELVAHSAFWGGVAVPALLLVALILLPYLDRKRAGVGVWFGRERRVAVTIFTICVVATVVFTVIGTYFRGPNWGWVWPWTASAVIAH
jgi:quinol-cytochrome oxidoreductase complex cytochrome b subunit